MRKFRNARTHRSANASFFDDGVRFQANRALRRLRPLSMIEAQAMSVARWRAAACLLLVGNPEYDAEADEQ